MLYGVISEIVSTTTTKVALFFFFFLVVVVLVSIRAHRLHGGASAGCRSIRV